MSEYSEGSALENYRLNRFNLNNDGTASAGVIACSALASDGAGTSPRYLWY